MAHKILHIFLNNLYFNYFFDKINIEHALGYYHIFNCKVYFPSSHLFLKLKIHFNQSEFNLFQLLIEILIIFLLIALKG